MKPKKRLAIRQLPALAKRFNAIPKRRKIVRGKEINYKALQFGKEFAQSFFPKRDAWIGRALIEMWERRVGDQWFLDRMRKHLRSQGVKTTAEANAIIERKMEQTLKKIESVLKTLTLQRSKSAQEEVGPTYHTILGMFHGIKYPCTGILQDLRKTKKQK